MRHTTRTRRERRGNRKPQPSSTWMLHLISTSVMR